jgi:hypothetical protein
MRAQLMHHAVTSGNRIWGYGVFDSRFHNAVEKQSGYG